MPGGCVWGCGGDDSSPRRGAAEGEMDWAARGCDSELGSLRFRCITMKPGLAACLLASSA